MHTQPAIAAAAHAFAEGSVASVQNGIGNEEVLAAHCRKVIRGTTFPAGRLTSPGVVAWEVQGDTTLGPFEDSPAPLAEVEVLAEALHPVRGCPCRAVADARGPRWRKVMLQRRHQPAGRAHPVSPTAPCASAPRLLRALASQLVAEGTAVAAAQGIVLDADPEDLIDHAARPEVAYGHKASMLQDVEAHRQTEVDYLNGAVADFGRRYGVPTPGHEIVWALVKGMEGSWKL